MKKLVRILFLAALATACAKRGQLRVVKKPPVPVAPLFVGTVDGAEAKPTLTPTPQPAPEPVMVTVKRGDNLWNLSRKHLGRGTRYAEISDLNNIKDPWWIFPGQKFEIPMGASPSARATVPAPAAPKAAAPPSKKSPFPKRKNPAFAQGERLTFAVQYGKITAGYAVLSIPETVTWTPRPALHIVAEAVTHPFFETFFKVRDRIETFIDTEALISWRYEKHLREGGYKADAFYLFDQHKQMMYEPDKATSVTVQAETQDVLSCFYYARAFPLNVGESIYIKVAADNMKSYELKVDVLRKEKAETLAGDFDCVVVQPHLKYEGVFQQKGEVFLWLTDDERHIPVKIRSKIAIGSININLQDADWVQPSP